MMEQVEKNFNKQTIVDDASQRLAEILVSIITDSKKKTN